MKSKKTTENRVILAHVMQPSDANPMGNVHGGTIVKLIDTAAGVVAMRHTRSNAVTASIDRMDFHYPVYVGDLLILRANLNYVGSSSMEIGVRAEAENMITGKVHHTASAYLTFVALDENGRPKKAPLKTLETREEKRRYQQATERRKERLAR